MTDFTERGIFGDEAAEAKKHKTRVMVAVPQAPLSRSAVVIAWDGGDFSIEADNVGGVFTDDYGLAPPDEPGLWVWQGVIRWFKCSSFEDEGSEPDFDKGTWRRPTGEEIVALALGRPPWAPTTPSDPLLTARCLSCGGPGAEYTDMNASPNGPYCKGCVLRRRMRSS